MTSEEAKKNKPKQPTPAYFKFRSDKLKELEGQEDRVNKIKQLWETIDPKEKAKYEAQYEEERADYNKAMDIWREKYHIEKGPARKSKGKENKSQVEKEKGESKADKKKEGKKDGKKEEKKTDKGESPPPKKEEKKQEEKGKSKGRKMK